MDEFPKWKDIFLASGRKVDFAGEAHSGVLISPPESSKWDGLYGFTRYALVLFSVLCSALLFLLIMSCLREMNGWNDQAAKQRCDAFVSEGFETETRWSKQVGCMARRTDGWERL